MDVAIQKGIPPCGVGLGQAHPRKKTPAIIKQSCAGLGQVTVHPTHSGVWSSSYLYRSTRPPKIPTPPHPCPTQPNPNPNVSGRVGPVTSRPLRYHHPLPQPTHPSAHPLTSLDFCSLRTSRRDSLRSANKLLIRVLLSWIRPICSSLTLE